MASLDHLEVYTEKIAAASKILSRYSRDIDVPFATAPSKIPQSFVPTDAASEAHRARQSIITNAAKLQILLREPADFIQQLAIQNQLLACLQWLGEFQVLACIPLRSSVPFKDVADIVGVPEAQLCRIVHMTAAAGFLQQPQPGHVAHTPLSAPFVTKPSFLDAAMFLSETVAPSALHMAEATQRFGHTHRPEESAYNVAFNASATFASIYEKRSKLQRQWPAYLHYIAGDIDASITEVLTQLDWRSIGKATIVEVGAQSTIIATALADLYPDLEFIVQMFEPEQPQKSPAYKSPLATPNFLNTGLTPGPASSRMRLPLNSRITVQQRARGTLQNVHDGAVYLFHLSSGSPRLASKSLLSQISAELRAHMGVLRANSNATLVLLAQLLPEPPEAIDANIETIAARLQDLSLIQLTNEPGIRSVDIIDMLNSVRDRFGRLVLASKLCSRNNSTIVAFEIRYQAADLYDM